MAKSISAAFKRYTRSIVYICLTILMFIMTNKGLSKYFDKILYFGSYIRTAMEIGLVGYVFFALLAYEYMRKVRSCGMQEALRVIPGAQIKLFVAQFLILVVLLVAWFGNVCVWLVKGYQKFEVTYGAMMKNTALSAILYLFMPGLVAIFLGTFLAVKTNRGIAYAVIVLLSFLCSSVPIELSRYEGIMVFESYINSYANGKPGKGKNVEWEDIEVLTEGFVDSRWMTAYENFKDLFLYKVSTLGDEALKEIYAFLQNPTGNEIEFLYNLGVENND